MACPITNFNAASEVLLAKPKIFNVKRPQTSSGIRAKRTKGNEEPQEQASHSIGVSIQTTRRAAIGLGIIAVSLPFSGQNALAADDWNGLWLTGPLPVPSVDNIYRQTKAVKPCPGKSYLRLDSRLSTSDQPVFHPFILIAVFGRFNWISNPNASSGKHYWTAYHGYLKSLAEIANEKTGTRSFLKKGIYMADIGPEGSAYRLRSYAFDLLALEDLMGQNAWNYFRQYLRQKSTVMYYDFDKVISAAPDSGKQSLTDLANKLFDNVEMLEDAVKKRDEPQITSYYEDTKALLQEVRARMA